MPPLLKLLTEIGPLVAFFIAYKAYGMMTATATIIVVTLLCTAISYAYTKTLPKTALISVILITVFGGLTLLANDSTFIKMKLTAINALFALILLGGAYLKKGLLRHVMGEGIVLTDKGWHILSVRFGLFFAGVAILNEIIWRHFPEEIWVDFKVFGVLPLMLAFIAFQIPVFKKHQISSHVKEE